MVDSDNFGFSSTISFEQRFNCLICWAPNLRMIYGSCQHRLCENCLYDTEGNRRFGLERCPTCQRENAFPVTRPDIPEDNIEIQVQLGVRKCPNSRCKLQMWHWEVPDHLQKCPKSKPVKRKGLDDSFESPMTLRSHSKKHFDLVTDKTTGGMTTRSKGHNLRPRRERNKIHTK
ncbi:uncharacterized protein LOC144634448 [Oculina patagonica]